MRSPGILQFAARNDVNPCHFSPCRRYRYALTHDVDDLFGAPAGRGYVAWIGLNPSRADEGRLDPTLWRVRAYTHRFGFRAFKMLNLFAYRATDPRALKKAVDPVGPDNDFYLMEVCRQAELVVCCWGADGEYLGRDRQVVELLRDIPLHALGLTKMGHPRHPLYLKGTCRPIPFAGSLAMRCAAAMAGAVTGQSQETTRPVAMPFRTRRSNPAFGTHSPGTLAKPLRETAGGCHPGHRLGFG